MTSRHGITWIEVAVAGGALAILAAVLLPAVHLVRENSRRTTCLANLERIGNAAWRYLGRRQQLPPGVPVAAEPRSRGSQAEMQGPNWLARLLPELGETPLVEQLAEAQAAGETNIARNCPARMPELRGVPAALLCPCSPQAGAVLEVGPWRGLGKGSYAGNFGADTFRPSDPTQRGVFEIVASRGREPAGPTTWRELSGVTRLELARAGTGTTLLASEVLATASPCDGRGAWLWSGMGGAAFTARLLPNAKGLGTSEANRDRIALCDESIAESDPLHCIAHGSDDESGTFAAARSGHDRGVHVVFADGHTAFLPDIMDLQVWRSLATLSAD